MIYYFPQPYPDELFYSILARYSKRTPEINNTVVIHSLFNTKLNSLGKSIPFGISNVLAQLKIFSFPSENEIIRNHTLFYFYTNFISPVIRKEKYKELLYGSVQGDKRKRLNGITLANSSTNFRFCPNCMDEDIEKYGETYWRTSFQLPTVFICQKHKTLLEDSKVSIYTNGLIPATRENCIRSTKPNKRRITQKTIVFLIMLAIESDRLAKKELNFYLESHGLVLLHLMEKGLLDNYGVVKKELLNRKLIEYYGINFFEITNFDPTVFAEIYCEGLNLKFNSLDYLGQLIMIIFLTGNIKNFLTVRDRDYEFIHNARCRNRKCKRNIRVSIYSRFKNEMRRKITTISQECSCGLNFEFILGNKEVYKQSAYSFYLSYNSDVLIKNIRDELYLSNSSIPEVAKLFNLHVFLVEKMLYNNMQEEVNQSLIQKYRDSWNQHIIANPTLHYLQLKDENLKVFTWLYRNDRNWLENTIVDSFGNELEAEFVRKRDFMVKEYIRSELYRKVIYQYKGSRIIQLIRALFAGDNHLKHELKYLPKSFEYVKKITHIYSELVFEN